LVSGGDLPSERILRVPVEAAAAGDGRDPAKEAGPPTGVPLGGAGAALVCLDCRTPGGDLGGDPARLKLEHQLDYPLEDAEGAQIEL
jgi:hypothetical protein